MSTEMTNLESEFSYEDMKKSGWYAHTWYDHKLHNNTFAMVLPVEDSHLCRFLVRVDLHGAGTATTMTATRMKWLDAFEALKNFYKHSQITPRINFGAHV